MAPHAETQDRGGDDILTALDGLPPVFRPVVALREGGDAVARAVALAPREGAGTLAWVRAYDRIEAAVVLEPELPLAAARLALFAAVSALADAIGVLGPPELPVTLRWPATLRLNGGAVGVARLAAPEDAAEDAVPPWLVVGIEARFAFPDGHEPGRDPDRTSLAEEGFCDVTPAELTAAWARHLMAGLADWQERGPRHLAEPYLARLEPVALPAGLAAATGEVRRGIDPASGDLVLERGGHRHRLSLRAALCEAAPA